MDSSSPGNPDTLKVDIEDKTIYNDNSILSVIVKVKPAKGAMGMLSDEEFRRLLDILDRPWAGFRKIRKGVKKRVRRHMEKLGCTTFKSYIGYIEKNPMLRDECESCLRVTISRFYRDCLLWEHLQTRTLPELINWFPEGLMAWSAGCANGEEPYTLAMVWETLVTPGTTSPPLRILATDTNDACLQRAKAGRYPLSSLKEVPDPLKTRWFRKVPGTRLWQIDPLLHGRIEWKVHDLLDLPPEDALHLIMLRNDLLTYYQGNQLQAALKDIIRSLLPVGVLILGSHEQMPSDLPFTRDPLCPWIYRKEG